MNVYLEYFLLVKKMFLDLVGVGVLAQSMPVQL